MFLAYVRKLNLYLILFQMTTLKIISHFHYPFPGTAEPLQRYIARARLGWRRINMETEIKNAPTWVITWQIPSDSFSPLLVRCATRLMGVYAGDVDVSMIDESQQGEIINHIGEQRLVKAMTTAAALRWLELKSLRHSHESILKNRKRLPVTKHPVTARGYKGNFHLKCC